MRPSEPVRQQAPQLRQSSSMDTAESMDREPDDARAWISAYGESMRGTTTWLFIGVLLVSCSRGEAEREVELPNVAPDTVVASWSVTSRTRDRDSLQVVLQADRTLVVTNRTADGTMMSLSRTISKEEYARFVGRLRELDCCALRSTERERPSPDEAKPALDIDFGNMQCEVELWDSDWREGKARDCGLAMARLHGGGFVPDPPFDDARP